MSHALFGERFLGVRTAAWHGLGLVLPEPVHPLEAIAQARLDFNIHTAPLLVDLGGVMTGYGKVAIVRDPTDDDPQYRVFGEAKEGYTVLNNADIARIVSPLAERWPLETVGALEQGMTMFMTLSAGEAAVRGDPIMQYFLITDTRDGQTSFRIAFTPIRVVCQNTLEAGKHAAIASATLRHVAGLEDEVGWQVTLLQQMQNVQGKMMTNFEALANAALTTKQSDAVFEAAYPYPRKPRKVLLREEVTTEMLEACGGLLAASDLSTQIYQAAIARADERRTTVRELFGKFGDEQPTLANTAWAAYNAVVEFEDFREAQGKETDPLVSALFGDRAAAKARAFEAAYAIVSR